MPKLKSLPKLSVSLKNSTWDLPHPMLPSEYITCDSDQHRLSGIQNMLTNSI